MAMVDSTCSYYFTLDYMGLSCLKKRPSTCICICDVHRYCFEYIRCNRCRYSIMGIPYKIFFMVPPLFSADLTIIPVVFSLAYHYGKTWRRYTVYSVIISFLFAYLIEPFFAWANMYQKYNFHHWVFLISINS